MPPTTLQIIEQIKTLPTDSLDDLAAYVDFLRFKAGKADDPEPAEKPLRVVNLRGLLKGSGIDVSPEALAEARREMWRKFEDVDPFKISIDVDQLRRSLHALVNMDSFSGTGITVIGRY